MDKEINPRLKAGVLKGVGDEEGKSMSNRTLKVVLDSRGVLQVSLHRPEVRNAFNEVMIEELNSVFGTQVQDPKVRVVVLKAEGPVFCSGGDLNWMKQAVDFTYEQNLEETRRLTGMFTRLNECPKPLIGAIHGAAIGGGVGLVSVCDVCIATQDTQFSLSEVKLGIVPACIGPFVIAKIGASHARGLFVSAERFLAERAQRIGLIHEVVSNAQDLNASVEKVVNRILECGPEAMKAAKKLVLDLSWPERRSEISDCYEYVSKTLADLRVSKEGQEGVRAFLEKRKPSWLEKSGN